MVKLSLVQFAPKVGDRDGNLSKIEELAYRTQSDVIVFPELATTGYAYPDKKSLMPYADEAGIDEGAVGVLKKISKEKNCMVVCGFAEKSEEKVFNSAMITAPDGNITVYRKLHLFSREKKIFTPGEEPPPLISFKGVIFTVLICYDWFFTELFRLRSMDGAQVFLHCANLVLPWCQTAMRERALTNRVFIATANRTGREREGSDDYSFTGKSQILDFRGEIIASLEEEEGVLEAQIEPSETLCKNVTKYDNAFNDRRGDIYELKWKDDKKAATAELEARATAVKEFAYAPYSGVKVGAALEDERGKVFCGCNVENASFGLTVCAERSAINAMIAGGGRKIKKLSIASDGGFVPCGACLGAIAEFSEDIPITTINKNGEKKTWKLSDLYPIRFSKEDLLR